MLERKVFDNWIRELILLETDRTNMDNWTNVYAACRQRLSYDIKF